ncbi:hypothetical protein [Nostoc sp. TCL240-02]|uniref:hypothetical protein n=1 Tax=Nostoc sp. TCL240-02 TaxID=2572090 RepID=UPI00157FA0BD|nr:hypothetical protein [Nostoc sp. TCL240-02]QKQ76215.1 hypothetical protein FBB35_25625 [Nostoc sp. TCL240-02]
MISPLFNISYTKPVESYTEFEKNIILIFGLFYISAGALTYQIEHLVRQRIISVYSGTKKTDASKSKSDFNTDQELSRLRGEMGAHKMKSNVLSNKEQTVVTKTKHKYRNLNKNWLVIFLIFSIAIVIYLSSQFIEIFPLISKNPTQIPSSSILVTPSPVISESPTVLLQTDTFREAVSKAINAANLTQSAKSPDEWKIVVSEWEAAIALMKTVPSSSPNYAIAQQKIIEYQKNINYAQKNAVGGK